MAKIPVDQGDPALGLEHRVAEGGPGAGLAESQREHDGRGDGRPSDADRRVARVIPGGQHQGRLDQQVDRQRGEGAADQAQRLALAGLPGAGQLPDHDRGCADLDE